MYAHVNDGVISPPQSLPQSWAHPDGRTVSNLPVLTQEELADLGWHPVSESAAPSFDPLTQAVDVTYSFDAGIVSAGYHIRAANTEEIAQAKISHNSPILNELAMLDLKIPRGLEDTWVASSFDTATLPGITQTNLTRKRQLRLLLK